MMPRVFIIFAFLSMAFGENLILNETWGNGSDVEKILFDEFIKTYDRHYQNPTEFALRFANFAKNLKALIEVTMTTQNTTKFHISKFMDKTTDELKGMLSQPMEEPLGDENIEIMPESPLTRADRLMNVKNFDWRKLGKVTPVRNQGSCGSCWAFAATSVVESKIAMKTGRLLDLSEQELVDCEPHSYGCNGGWPSKALSYVKTHGLSHETLYPYKSRDGVCIHQNRRTEKFFINGFMYLSPDEKVAAQQIMTHGPAVIKFLVPYSFFHYRSGIYRPTKYECNNSMGGHAMAIVGFGEENGIPYWLIKNSWGTTWGEVGYFKLYRGAKSCFIYEDHRNLIIAL